MRPLFVLLVAWLCGTTARADVVAMLEIQRDGAIAEQHEWSVTHVITDFFAQRESPVVLPHQARERLQDQYRACPNRACAARYLEQLMADLAVSAAIYSDSEDLEAIRISVIRPGGLTFSGTANVADRSVEAAAREALDTAFQRHERGLGPWIEVVGNRGQKVHVDGKPVGEVPLHTRVAPGRHRVRVEAANGELRYEVSVRVPKRRTHYTVVTVPAAAPLAAPEPDPAPALARLDTASEHQNPVVSPYNFAAGGLLTALGAYGLGMGVFAATHDGECVSGAPPCETYAFKSRDKVLLGAGAGLVALGITWLAWRPLRTRPNVEISRSRATLSMQGEF